LKRIYVNLKRFDVPPELGGVNRLSSSASWAQTIISEAKAGLQKYFSLGNENTGKENLNAFTFFFPEAHIMQAIEAKGSSEITIGCQGIHWHDIVSGGNFGAFTSSRPAAAMAALGCRAVIIGHCEERRNYAEIFSMGGSIGNNAGVNQILGNEITAARKRDLEVLYCIGEKAEEQDAWQEVLGTQLEAGLCAAPDGRLVIGYEPVWAIGPGKTPPDRAYIEKIARFIKAKAKEISGIENQPVVYGGGLKADNAAMLASIPEIDGGLIALTRFSGEIGFYTSEYLEIVDLYFKNIIR
jgi:triosephosphate isomerase